MTPEAGRKVRRQYKSGGKAIGTDETQAALIGEGAIQFLALNPQQVMDRVVSFASPIKKRSDDGMNMGVGFSPDGRDLIVTLKGNHGGSVDVFGVTASGRLSSARTTTTVGGHAFAFPLDPAGPLGNVHAPF